MRRRQFLQSAAAAGAAISLPGCSDDLARIEGGIIGQSHAIGHRLRSMDFSKGPTKTHTADVVILGAGIAGLTAALRLYQAGVEKIKILDLETEPGGNSRYGTNTVSEFPWAAHYVPIPGSNAVEVICLFEEFGVITGYDAEGKAVYNEHYLCADPEERLFIHGIWQEGLNPTLGASEAELKELHRFAEQMESFKKARGSDGKRPFSIPIDESSADPEWQSLDSMTMAEWLKQQNYTSNRLRWLVDYSCRDDYGGDSTQVSAWAGLHYFASRDEDEVLTWPAGNGWLVQQMLNKLPKGCFQQALVHRVSSTNDHAGVQVDVLDIESGESHRWNAKAAVCALPRFIAQRVIEGLPVQEGLQYSPWVVANLTWNTEPPEFWDNVLYGSRSLGYVVATHQALHPFPKQSVLTWYQTRHHLPPAQAREEMLQKPWSYWRDEILADLRPAHPDVEKQISRIDIMLWGHGMIRPVPGFISGESRRQMAQPHGRIAFAHSDMSGISIFEEACTLGAVAAKKVLDWFHPAT